MRDRLIRLFIYKLSTKQLRKHLLEFDTIYYKSENDHFIITMEIKVDKK